MGREKKVSRFDVLNKETEVNSHLILEASAGTGKTFSIENLVVRLLVEGENPLRIDEILIVTFTKMATSDLRVRVRDNIVKAMNALEEGVVGCFDYLSPILENEESRIASRRRLERALIGFDEAQIFTIHSFCFRMISEYGMDGCMASDPQGQGKGIGEEHYRKSILDYFRTGLNDDSIGSQHKKHALNSQKGQIDLLQKKLGEIIAKGMEIVPVPTHTELVEEFKETVDRLKTKHQIFPDKLQSDLEKLAKSMRKETGYDSQRIELLAELVNKSEVTDTDFERLVEEGPKMFKFLDPSNKKVKFPDSSEFNYPHLLDLLQNEFSVFKYKNLGMARMAYDCQKLTRRQFDEEELKSFDDLLEVMSEKINNSQFLLSVRKRYRAAIVDEFQDTDPRQWGIFKTLFPPDNTGWGHLYLVGDPKQSIYAFRQADIYTYLDAADAIGQENLYSLDTNYRSQPSLVAALNQLFTEPFDKGWIPLPKLKKFMDVPIVEWDEKKRNQDFFDNCSALHFCIHETKKYEYKKSEEEGFFPFFVQEIQRLNRECHVPLKSFAILVADRHQATRVGNFLKIWKIPSHRQRVEPISESPVISALKELLFGIYHYRDESALKTALGGHFIRWNNKRVESLENDEVLALVISKFRGFEERWRNEGLSVCMEELLTSCWQMANNFMLTTIILWN